MPVGEVVSVETTPEMHTIAVSFHVDLDRVREVAVVLQTEHEALPESVRQILARLPGALPIPTSKENCAPPDLSTARRIASSGPTKARSRRSGRQSASSAGARPTSALPPTRCAPHAERSRAPRERLSERLV